MENIQLLAVTLNTHFFFIIIFDPLPPPSPPTGKRSLPTRGVVGGQARSVDRGEGGKKNTRVHS